MTRLNYHDLLGLLIEYDISSLLEYKRQLADKENEASGVEVVEATANDFIPFTKKVK